MSNKLIGDYGEEKACDYLKNKGFEIIERNWRTRNGEIDIIVKKADLLVFVEVKTLPKGNIDVLKRVLNPDKLKRILKTSKRFLINNRQYSNSLIRFDVVVIDMPGFESVYHIENAFTE